MSLLLDALKKAADDKKKSVDDSPAESSTGESLTQDSSRTNDDDSLELELDEKQIIDNDLADDYDFPQVEDQPFTSQTQQVSAPTNNRAASKAPDNNNKLQPGTPQDDDSQEESRQADSDTEHTEPATELQLTDHETAETTVTDSPGENDPGARQSDPLTATETTDSTSTDTASTDRPAADQSSMTEAADTTAKAMKQTDRAYNNTDNQAALSALIHKSNQYQRRAQKKRNILLVTLILLLISVSALFFYLKTEMASHELYIAQNNSSPLQREPVTVSERPPSATDNQTTLADNRNNKPLTADHTHNAQTASHSHSTEMPITNKPKLAQSQADRPATGKVTTKPAETKIHIQQSSRDDPIDSLIMNAYSSFQHGQYEQAEALYQQVLEQEPRNRDANLGLAAIALKQQRYEYARQKYLALLQLNPKDSLAIAGLSSINQGSLQNLDDAALSESQLKFMLKEQPDAAHLYFALGSLYAGKNQWPQAQSAYFSAWSADSNNADYAFNLAVSLDHINQSKQALQYYQLCLKLTRNTRANFSVAQVQQRINSLQETMQ
jgi:tetratricopeptide (TPR) repeat protein